MTMEFSIADASVEEQAYPTEEADQTEEGADALCEDNMVSQDISDNTGIQDFFSFLGSNPEENEKKRESLHEEIKKRWDIFLKGGLSKEQREELAKKYPIFGNCPLLKPPQLNPEIQSCLDSKALRHDQFLENLQLQLGHALSASGG
ncbi:uncharacterized protein [Leptinotarsa decemlineata]|uniref:uncharacterized protein n=1 Tax=Leptinotarsa decemlineata TaxID=7539 RepID=UPI003D3067ED